MRTIQNCSVCVIGGAGFLGSHMVEHLIVDRKCRVLVLDNLITGKEKHIHPGAEFIWYDIREDEYELARLLGKFNTQYVFNYAAEPYIPECFERPMHFFDINAVSVLRVMNACQRAGVEALLQVSSAEIYGEAKGKISEDTPVVPHSTYGVSKVAADGLVQVRWREAKVPAIALRQFNCVGERETHEYVIPEIISQLHEHGPEVRLGNNSTRDFLYAGDQVRIATELLEKGQFGEVYNLGSEQAITIGELAYYIAHLMGYSEPQVILGEADRVRPWEIWHLQSDNTKIYGAISYRPQVPLQEALRRTIDYFYNNDCKWDW